MSPEIELAAIDEAIAHFAEGHFVVIIDDEEPTSGGSLAVPADAVDGAAVRFLMAHTDGAIVAAVDPDRADALDIPSDPGRGEGGRPGVVSLDAAEGTTTGLSTTDRARTLGTLADPHSTPTDFFRPGHILAVRTRVGGVLGRADHAEAAVDLTVLAGRAPVGALARIVDHDGEPAELAAVERLAASHRLPIVQVADLIHHRRRREKLVERLGEARLPTRLGELTAVAYRSILDGEEHVAFVHGAPDSDRSDGVLARLHSECLTGDVIGSLRCDCGPQLDAAFEMMAAEGAGVVVYLRGHEGRGIGIGHKIRAYALQDEGYDTVDANLALGLPIDDRDYGVGAQILVDLGLRRIRLLTNNPAKPIGIAGYDIDVVALVPVLVGANEENVRYLETKHRRMGHLLSSPREGV